MEAVPEAARGPLKVSRCRIVAFAGQGPFLLSRKVSHRRVDRIGGAAAPPLSPSPAMLPRMDPLTELLAEICRTHPAAATVTVAPSAWCHVALTLEDGSGLFLRLEPAR